MCEMVVCKDCRHLIKKNLCGVVNRRVNIHDDRDCGDFLDKSVKVGDDLFRK